MKKRFYIFESGSLIRQYNSIAFIDKYDNKTYVPIYQIEKLFIYGHCIFNKEVVSLLFQHNVSILLFSFNGRYLGGYFPNINKLGKCLIEQVNILNDNEKKAKYQKEIICSSITNMLAVLKYYDKKGRNLGGFINEIE